MIYAGAQAVLLLLVLYAFTLPLLVAAFVNTLWLAILIDIIAVQSFFALNEVARDLEDPFVYEPNDLPMARLQVVRFLYETSNKLQLHKKDSQDIFAILNLSLLRSRP